MKKEFLTDEQINNLQGRSEQEIYQFLQGISSHIISNEDDKAIFQEVKDQLSDRIASVVKVEVDRILTQLIQTNKTIAEQNNKIFMASFAKLLFEYFQLKKKNSNSINIDVKLFSDMYNYIIGHSFNTQADNDLISRLDHFAKQVIDISNKGKSNKDETKQKYQPDYLEDDLYDAFSAAPSIEEIFKLFNKLQGK